MYEMDQENNHEPIAVTDQEKSKDEKPELFSKEKLCSAPMKTVLENWMNLKELVQ
ncbi:24922_t:CDS:2 [Gigaspora rosea]|nr:24922_t:CDS:2 [Gigaspora rosea]